MTNKDDINYRMPTIRVLEGSRQQKFEVQTLLNEAGIDSAQLKRNEGFVDSQQFVKLLLAIKYALSDEFYGLTRRPAKLGTLSMMTEVALHAKNLQGALLGMSRFIELVSDDLQLNIVQDNETVRLQVTHSAIDSDSDYFLTDYFLFLFHRLSSWLVGYLIPVQEVDFSGPPSDSASRFIDLLSPQWNAGASPSAVCFHAKYLAMPIVRNTVEWFQHVENIRGGLFSWPRSTASIVDKVRRILSSRLREHKVLPTLQWLASEMAMSPQTLRRRLYDEGTGFQRLADELRCDLAIEALSLRRQNIDEVSELLGFSDSRSFSRAFKKWTGIPPSEYLRRVLITKK